MELRYVSPAGHVAQTPFDCAQGDKWGVDSGGVVVYTYIVIELPCACASLRRAARAVTQIYEDELRDFGLRATQLTLLQALARTGPITQGALSEILVLDGTTLTRSLRPLVESGWIRRSPGRDRRERHLELTAAGRRKLESANVGWERAQRRLRKGLGERAWERMHDDLAHITQSIAS